MNNIEAYRALLDGYEEGMYTDAEVVFKSLEWVMSHHERDRDPSLG